MKYDVLLFTDHVTGFWHMKALGAYRIASELRSNGYTVKVIDYASIWFSKIELLFKVLDNLIGPNTIFVGFSTTFLTVPEWIKKEVTSTQTYSLYPCSNEQFNIVSKYIKKKFPQIKLVLGGAKIDLDVKIDKNIDFVILGLADNTVIELANHLKKKTPLKYTYNLNNPTYKILNHDVIARNFDFVNSQTLFQDTDHVFTDEVLPIETSRGCMFKCKFCDFPLLGRKKTDPDYHKHIDVLASEFKRNFAKFKTTKYMIVDDTFNETISKLQRIKDSLIKINLQIKFSTHARLDLLGKFPEQIKLLKDIGLETVFFGIESLNHASLKSIGKSISPNKIKDLLQMCNEQWKGEVSIHTNFIAGLPYETPDTLYKWLEWVESDDNPADSFGLSPLVIRNKAYDSSIFSEFPEKYGYILSDELGWQNDVWNFLEVKKIAEDFTNKNFLSGRIKVGAADFSGLQNLGYTYKDLKGLAYKDLSTKDLKLKYFNKFEEYKNCLLAFEQIS